MAFEGENGKIIKGKEVEWQRGKEIVNGREEKEKIFKGNKLKIS